MECPVGHSILKSPTQVLLNFANFFTLKRSDRAPIPFQVSSRTGTLERSEKFV